VVFRVDLRLRSPIIIIFRSRGCEQTTEQSRTLECNPNSRGEKSSQNGEKIGMRGEKSGENGEKYCMDTGFPGGSTPSISDDRLAAAVRLRSAVALELVAGKVRALLDTVQTARGNHRRNGTSSPCMG
jgi:hypothetical protein